MGEIAEMMLEGLLDEETGELIDGEAPGYPRRMSASGGNLPRTDAEQAARREKNRRKRARQKVKRERLSAAAPDLLEAARSAFAAMDATEYPKVAAKLRA